jgi:nitroimidazol reductase NimA-like FMN-containing flavoprotein (pyridoxamine 5'-phosphate oxidase superfamily)
VSEQKEKDMSRKEMMKLLAEEDTGVLCMSRDGEPYGVTLSYALVDGEIVFHGAAKGTKLDFIAANPRVCFIVSRHPDRTIPHRPDSECNYRYESVHCFGKARIIEDPAERLDYLRKFKAHFDTLRDLDPAKGHVPDPAAVKTGVVVVSIDEITGRRKA